MRFLIKFIYCLSAALCTVLCVYGKILNVYVIVFSKKLENQKKEKNQKNCMCAVFLLGIKKNCLHTLYILCIHINVANEWSMI